MSTDATPPAERSRTQAERRATTEARLLAAAYRIVADQGVRAVTTAAVGELAGYSRGIVNHHFGSRAELMVRLAEATQRNFVPDPGPRRGREHVLSVVDDYLALLHSSPADLRVFLRLWAAVVGNDEPSLDEPFTRRDKFFRDYFEDAINEGVADGSIRADIDPPATAVAIVGLIRGIAMQCQYDPALTRDDRVHAAALAFVDGALSSRPPKPV
ncbi:TetR/AcrR family transcriptional regulator [Dactylosporangium sp. CA-092794]|uniref:TetR/AcrR family transcriptional regulator n=1 Tax=Dactylosporangium sp. CA-092794 TaxID=3239929 RepID=UPI003D924DF1